MMKTAFLFAYTGGNSIKQLLMLLVSSMAFCGMMVYGEPDDYDYYLTFGTSTWTLTMTMSNDYCSDVNPKSIEVTTKFYKKNSVGADELAYEDLERSITTDCSNKIWSVDIEDDANNDYVYRVEMSATSNNQAELKFSSLSLSSADDNPEFGTAVWWPAMESFGNLCLSYERSTEGEDCHPIFDFFAKYRYDMTLDSYNEAFKDKRVLTDDEITLTLLDANGSTVGEESKSDIISSIREQENRLLYTFSIFVDQNGPSVYDARLTTNGYDQYFIDHIELTRQEAPVYSASGVPRKNRRSNKIAEWGKDEDKRYSYCLSTDTDHDKKGAFDGVICHSYEQFCVADCENVHIRKHLDTEDYDRYHKRISWESQDSVEGVTVKAGTRDYIRFEILEDIDDSSSILRAELSMWDRLLPISDEKSHIDIDILGDEWLCLSNDENDFAGKWDELVGNKCMKKFETDRYWKVSVQVADFQYAGSNHQVKLTVTTTDGGQFQKSSTLGVSGKMSIFSVREIHAVKVEMYGSDAVAIENLTVEEFPLENSNWFNSITGNDLIDNDKVLCLSSDIGDFSGENRMNNVCATRFVYRGFYRAIIGADDRSYAGTDDKIEVDLEGPGGNLIEASDLTFEQGEVHNIETNTKIEKIVLSATGGDALLLNELSAWYFPLSSSKGREISSLPNNKVLCLSTDSTDYDNLGKERIGNSCVSKVTIKPQ